MKKIMLFAFSLVIATGMRGAGYREANYAREPRFKALVCYSTTAEEAHVQFANQAVDFFKKLNYGEGFYLDFATDFSGFTLGELKKYSVIVMINTAPGDDASRDAFRQYMEQGGGWMGFHAAAYNDSATKWPWYNEFLGCGTFKCNNWPPQPALLEVNKPTHAVTRSLPPEFVAASSEWYQWNESPATRGNVDVLVSLSRKNYPVGLKDVVYGGDFPVVWTNRDYRMIYLNMGHGDEGFDDATNKLLYINAFRWIVSCDPSGNPFDK